MYVIGLILEGAGWDRRNNMLCESSNKVLYVNMPVVYIFALYNKPDKDPKLYEVSIYLAKLFINILMEIIFL